MSTPSDERTPELRRAAEIALAEEPRPLPSETDPSETVHELLVHQVELEMQNEELRRLQLLLEAQRAKYFELFDLAPVGYVTIDGQNIILEANLTAATQLVWPREKLAQTPLTSLIHPEDQDIFYLTRKQLLSDPPPRTCELRLLKSDRTPFWARLEISTVDPAKRLENSCFVSISDISETMKAREDLARREQEYRLLAENASDVVFRCNISGLIEWISPSVATRLGLIPEEMIGQRFRDLLHPDDTDRLDAAWISLNDGVSLSLEMRIRTTTDGYHWFSVSIHPTLDDGGHVTHLVGGWQNIQQVVLSRNELETERTRLRDILDTMFDPHVMLEPLRDEEGTITDFKFTDANEAACLYHHLTRPRIVGRHVRDLCPAVILTGLLDKCRDAFDSESPVVLDDFVYPREGCPLDQRLDIRAFRVGEALSYTWRDVTDRYVLAQKLAASEEHYRLLTENSYDTAVRVADDHTVLWVSPSIKNLLGWEPAEWIGQPITNFVAAESLLSLRANLARVSQGLPVVARYQARAKDGSHHWAESRAMPYIDGRGQRDGITAAFHLIDEQVAMEMELERRARTDELTNLLNRKEVFERLEAYNGRHPRTGQSIAILFCDMDNFKNVNDTHGHAVGDEVLRVTADRIRKFLRSTDDIGARVGGDELLVVLHGVRDLANAETIAEKLRQSAAEPITVPGGTVRATMSIGVTLARPGEKTEALIARADHAMYRAKETGRDQVISLDIDAAA